MEVLPCSNGYPLLVVYLMLMLVLTVKVIGERRITVYYANDS